MYIYIYLHVYIYAWDTIWGHIFDMWRIHVYVHRMCVTWMRHGSFMWVMNKTWLIHVSHVYHVTWMRHVHRMWVTWMRHDSFMWVIWLMYDMGSHIWYVTYACLCTSHESHVSFVWVMWLMSHSLSHVPFMWVMWLTLHSYVTHVSFVCDSCLADIHTNIQTYIQHTATHCNTNITDSCLIDTWCIHVCVHSMWDMS